METVQNSRRNTLKVAVVGGGMCGVAVTAGLLKAGIDVHLYEAAPEFGEIGAGVGLGVNAIRILQELGMLDEIVESVKPELPVPRAVLYRSGIGDHRILFDHVLNSDDKGLGIHRAIFLNSILPLVDPRKTHLNKRCINLHINNSGPNTPRVRLVFSDGTEAEADVVLGADGIRSIVRTFVVGDEERDNDVPQLDVMRINFTYTYAYRGLIDSDKLRSHGILTNLDERPQCFCGSGKHVITFPISGGTIINVVAFTCDHTLPWGVQSLPPGTPWVTPRPQDELLKAFSGWGPDVMNVLESLTHPSAWAVHVVDPPLESYVGKGLRGRVALLGDAAHGMLPHLGAGAGQGMEDVYALVRLLGHPQVSRDNVEDILKTYDALRRPRANKVLVESTRCGAFYDGFGPHGSGVSRSSSSKAIDPSSQETGDNNLESGIRADLEENMKKIFDWVWHYDLREEVDVAIETPVQKSILSSK
ncbi:FAD NAD-P-binding domain-containing [Pyrrhoderma noxium]|uniref:FAD NAD-P-binding domain-containing n=1 Tax=Pyrrhoderma noxium TaxID=2282107 RepID=A0A286UUK9_9AGAM|nr:FAD NAD-P-binding domain-containing [Pyrrhoderma noxium]